MFEEKEKILKTIREKVNKLYQEDIINLYRAGDLISGEENLRSKVKEDTLTLEEKISYYLALTHINLAQGKYDKAKSDLELCESLCRKALLEDSKKFNPLEERRRNLYVYLETYREANDEKRFNLIKEYLDKLKIAKGSYKINIAHQLVKQTKELKELVLAEQQLPYQIITSINYVIVGVDDYHKKQSLTQQLNKLEQVRKINKKYKDVSRKLGKVVPKNIRKYFKLPDKNYFIALENLKNTIDNELAPKPNLENKKELELKK